jgi:spermidine synthase
LPDLHASQSKATSTAQADTKHPLELWVRERHQDSAEIGFRVERTLFSQKSPYQQIDVVKTTNHGAVLLNDGIIMLTERDEFIYHEMIAHVPLFVHPSPKRVLVIGGGDGGTAREILKHNAVERVVMVEIDEVVVKACRRHLPSVSQALDDPRLEIIFADGVQYVAETAERFEVALVDSTDPIGPGVGLFEKPFYANMARVLTAQGILVTQAESPFYDLEFQQFLLSNQRPFFKRLHTYLYTTLAYVGGLYCFGFASKDLCPLRDFNAERFAATGITTRYYNADIHRAAFRLPQFLQETLREILDPLTD